MAKGKQHSQRSVLDGVEKMLGPLQVFQRIKLDSRVSTKKRERNNDQA